MKIAVIGVGRWGSFQAWYASRIFDEVMLYGRASSERFKRLAETRANEYLRLNDNIVLSSDLQETIAGAEFVVVSVGAQSLRSLARELSSHDTAGKTFVLCMKGIEKGTGKRLSQIMRDEVGQDIGLAVWLGPGHVQEFVAGIPNCMVIDADDPATTERIIDRFGSELIRFYYGQDIIGTEIGGATKNIIGIAAGILDGLGYSSLKGALMSRGTREVSRFIEAMGGNPLSAYGLAHLGDYEATLFSRHSHNRRYGESMVSGEKMVKLAEGVDTVKAVHEVAREKGIPMPITEALYKVIFEGAELKRSFMELFERPAKPEFLSSREYKE